MKTQKRIKQIISPLLFSGIMISPFALAENVIASQIVPYDIPESPKTITHYIKDNIEILEAKLLAGKKQSAKVAYHLALMTDKQGDKGKAFNFVNESVTLDPDNLNYLGYAANISFTLKKFKLTENYLLKMISLQQNTSENNHSLPGLLENLALIYQAQYRLADSIILLKEAIALEQKNRVDTPVSVVIHRLHRLTEMEILLGNYGQALRQLDKVVNIYQQNAEKYSQELAEAFHNIGEINRLMKNISQAEIAYHKAIDLWDRETKKGKNGIEITRKSISLL